MADISQLRRLLQELQSEGIHDSRVLAALEKVPRDLFVPREYRSHAFRNIPLPIGEGQTISQPYVVALMTQSLELLSHDSVLEVGTGSGYQSAVLAELCLRVVSIERIGSLASSARDRLAWLGYSNVRVEVGDGSLGCPEEAPFDGIIVTAASPGVPGPLQDQLAEGGRLVLPMGSRHSQELMLYVKRDGRLVHRSLGGVRFVPLVGAAAWKEQAARYFFEEWL